MGERGALNNTVEVMPMECPYCHLFVDAADDDGLLKCFGRSQFEQLCFAAWNTNGDLVRYPDGTPREVAS